ncbi:MAG: haloacid dehalogenase-like hydrolase [Cyclobacteriaceae bacterium]|nr:haloacid dehalogenase-like hydrolase [Cyclobacteriaceae bacterium]
MNIQDKKLLCSLAIVLTLASCQPSQIAPPIDPLPSWNDGTVKKAITDYVMRVTDTTSTDFIPAADRIATFDNDGTLWAERPYVQELFVFYQVKSMIAKDPSLAMKQPFKAVVEHDKAFLEKGGMTLLLELLTATHTGMTEDELEENAKAFFSSAVYPGKNVPVKQVRYQPQLELLDYLRDNGFKVYICTGGTVEFVRSISMDFYGVPSEQVIGSSFKYVFVDSTRSIYREPALNHFNDKSAKPAAIQLLIGKHPVLACGNEGGKGDIAMLAFSQAGKYPSLQLLVNHDDDVREFMYSEDDSASLKAAAQNKWQVISMKNDWKRVFPE